MSRVEAFNNKMIYWNLIKKIRKLNVDFIDLIQSYLNHSSYYQLSTECALLVYNIGYDEFKINGLYDNELYLGTNANYIINKLVNEGFVTRRIDVADRRATYVKLTTEGMELYQFLDNFIDKQSVFLNKIALQADETSFFHSLLIKLESFWHTIKREI
jgi:DNA-binding MarR family transcriptional regulator